MDELAWLRSQLDEVSRELIELIELRMRLVAQVGREKRRLGLPLRDAKRQEELIRRVISGREGGLDEDRVRRIFAVIFEESLGAMADLGERGHRDDGEPGASAHCSRARS